MKSMVMAVLVLLALESCASNSTIQPWQPGLRQTAAVQALGAGAVSTALVSPRMLQPGRIYHQDSEGRLHAICQNDFAKQPILMSMKPSQDARPGDTVKDTVYQTDVALAFGLGKGRVPYTRIEVTGYSVWSIDGIDDVPSYIVKNLASTCRRVTLKANRPYYITSAVAVADKADSYSRDAVDSVSIGPISYDGGAEAKDATRKNVVFGTVVQYVKR